MSVCDRVVFSLVTPLRLTKGVVVNCLLSLLVLGQNCLDWSATCILFSLQRDCKGVSSKALTNQRVLQKKFNEQALKLNTKKRTQQAVPHYRSIPLK